MNAADGLDEGTDTVTGVETFTFNERLLRPPLEMVTEAARPGQQRADRRRRHRKQRR